MIDTPEPEACLSCARRIGVLNRRVGDWCEACISLPDPAPGPSPAAMAHFARALKRVEERAAEILALAEADGTMAATRAALAQRIAERERRHAQ